MDNIYKEIIGAAQGNLRAALCIVTHTQGSTPRGPGAKMILFEDKTTKGTIGGGAVEFQIIEKAREFCFAAAPFVVKFNLENDLNMHCGGYMEIYIEPLNQASRLVIFGGGHVGGALADLAGKLGFEVTVIDEREEILGQYAGTSVSTLHEPFETSGITLETGNNTYIVVTTPRHKYDELITARCARLESAYLGMIGSKRKVEMARKTFREVYQLTEEQIARIDMPIGIPFHAETPEEIAVSILAKLIDVRNSIGKKNI